MRRLRAAAQHLDAGADPLTARAQHRIVAVPAGVRQERERLVQAPHRQCELGALHLAAGTIGLARTELGRLAQCPERRAGSPAPRGLHRHAVK
ncbi:MAG: hypothetical protein ACXVSA_19845, partial [Solirubrobacteraceae bacterium]